MNFGGATGAWLAFALLFAVALAPTVMVDIPAMVDYPNHLARMHILATAGTPDQSPYYQVKWALYPNLAMDLIVPPLGHLVGVEAATRWFLLLSQILVVTGAIAIEWAVKGRHRIAGFAALLALHGLPFAMGFVNFEFGLGVALWGIAAWLVLKDAAWTVRLAAHALFVALIFTAHLFALGIYGLTIGCYELWRLSLRRFDARHAAAVVPLLSAPVIVLLAIMMAAGGGVGGHDIAWHAGQKPNWVLLAMNGYSRYFSAISVVTVVLLLWLLRRQGLLAFATPAGKWIAAGFLLAFFALPFRLFDTAFTDVRVVTAAAFVLPAFVAIDIPNARTACVLVAVVAAIVVVNVGVVVHVWRDYAVEYAAFKRSFAMLDRGSRVFVGHSAEAPDPPDDLTEYPAYHVATLAAHYAKALVPTLFTHPGKQPLEVVQAQKHLTISDGGPVPLPFLKRLAEGRAEGGRYVQNWARDFDYLYLVGPPVANPMPDILDEVMHARRFTLYRIRRRISSGG